MPTRFKILISLAVIVVALVVYHFQSDAGQAVTPWIALGLGAFMIFSIWVFPEEQKKKKN